MLLHSGVSWTEAGPSSDANPPLWALGHGHVMSFPEDRGWDGSDSSPSKGPIWL